MHCISRCMMCGISCALAVTLLAVVDAAEPDVPPKDATMTKHVLWPTSRPRPSQSDYAKWYNSSDLAWVSENDLPQVAPDAKVDIFFLTKPVFGLIGNTVDVWHAGLGLRVENGPSFLFEYTSLDFLAAIAYPDKNKSAGADELLHWPTTAIVDYHIDASGKTFPVTGAKWKESYAIGSTTGAGLNLLSDWAFGYAVNNSRYLVWRLLEKGTERPMLDSVECFDFVFKGLRMLKALDATVITATELPRTIVNVYVSSIEVLNFNSSIGKFFASERRVLEEWVELTGEIPVRFGAHSKEWYWPAWFSLTPYAGGTGQLLQDLDYPKTYHRYALEWPSKSKSKATARGVQRTNVSVFCTGVSLLLV